MTHTICRECETCELCWRSGCRGYLGEPSNKADSKREKAAFDGWCEGYALTAEPNYSDATKADCWAAYQAGIERGRADAYPFQLGWVRG